MSLLTIDIGTTNIKGVVFSEDGKVLHKTLKRNSIVKDQKRFEIDIEKLWENVKEIISECSENSNKDFIRSISFSSSSNEIIFPIDKKGMPLANSFTAYDNRGSEFIVLVNSIIGADIFYEITRFPSRNTIGALHRILWFKKYLPDIYKKCWKFVDYNQYLFYKLGFEPISDYSNSSNGLYDFSKNKLSDFILNKLDISKEKLNNSIPSGMIIGKIQKKILHDLMLTKDVSLISGGFDQSCAALGSGVYKEGDASLGLGTTICLSAPKNQTKPDDISLRLNLHFVRQVYKDLSLALIYTRNGCSVLDWLKDNFSINLRHKFDEEEDFYSILSRRLKKAKNNLFVMPHFNGADFPYYDEDSRGTILGLDLNSNIDDITLGIIYGLSCEIRERLEILKETGLKINKIFVTGGGSKFDFWVETISNFCKVQLVTLQNAECSCVGCAIISGLALDLYKSIDEAIEIFVKEKKIFKPVKNDSYDIYYKKFSKIYKTVNSFYNM